MLVDDINKELLHLLGKYVGNDMTSTSELAKIGDLLFKEYFKGVFPADKIPTLKPKESCIANTDDHTKPGEHWVGLYCLDNGEVLSYDSFGRPIQIAGSITLNTEDDIEQQKTELNCGLRSLCFLTICYYWSPNLAKTL